MTQDMQKLHDAVLLLGDAALEIATALSVFMGSDAAPPWPNTGKPLTAERFHKLMADEDVAPPKVAEPPCAKSYVTGTPLSASRAAARVKATLGATSAGYDFECWCRRVRSVRIQMKVSTSGFAEILGVSPGAVVNWETGVCFAKSATRSQLERMAAHLCGTPKALWRHALLELPK
jgi:DNA-binding transcriptional regulator YiaG